MLPDDIAEYPFLFKNSVTMLTNDVLPFVPVTPIIFILFSRNCVKRSKSVEIFIFWDLIFDKSKLSGGTPGEIITSSNSDSWLLISVSNSGILSS